MHANRFFVCVIRASSIITFNRSLAVKKNYRLNPIKGREMALELSKNEYQPISFIQRM